MRLFGTIVSIEDANSKHYSKYVVLTTEKGDNVGIQVREKHAHELNHYREGDELDMHVRLNYQRQAKGDRVHHHNNVVLDRVVE